MYTTSARGSLCKDFGLKDQLCRAAVSAMGNIAEGFAKPSDRDFTHFLAMAKGSVLEVQSLLYVAWDVGYIDKDELAQHPDDYRPFSDPVYWGGFICQGDPSPLPAPHPAPRA